MPKIFSVDPKTVSCKLNRSATGKIRTFTHTRRRSTVYGLGRGGGGEGGGGGGAVSESSRHLAASGGEQRESRDFAATSGGWSHPIRGVVRTVRTYVRRRRRRRHAFVPHTRVLRETRETGAA